MRRRWIGWAAAAAVAACAPPRTESPAPAGPGPETAAGVTREVRSLGFSIGGPGALADFRPVVAPFGEQGRCVTIPDEGGGRLVLLRFENGPGGAERTVSVEYDAAGTPQVYADLRGDLTGDDGPLTSVTIWLVRGDAQAFNRSGDVPFHEGRADAALEMETLGSPRVMMERLRRECGTGAK